MSGQIARLALVSHVLYEREILEQKREIESLKLKLFWKDYGIRNLQTAVVCEANRRRFLNINEPMPDMEHWFLWMGPMIESCGMEAVLIDQDTDQLALVPPIDINVHFACRERYYVSHYGAKLWKATSVDDPELRKLKALFDALSHH
jgi:hypothetical protein